MSNVPCGSLGAFLAAPPGATAIFINLPDATSGIEEGNHSPIHLIEVRNHDVDAQNQCGEQKDMTGMQLHKMTRLGVS
jgi:hypothetical protein